MEKNITSIKIQNVDTFISPRGETRQIKLRGTAGSGFSLEINDNDGDCILEEELQNIEIPRSGVYILNQRFPSISTSTTGGLTEAYYEIKINAHADVSCDLDKITLYQYPDVTLTLSNSGTSARIHQKFNKKIRNCFGRLVSAMCQCALGLCAWAIVL